MCGFIPDGITDARSAHFHTPISTAAREWRRASERRLSCDCGHSQLPVSMGSSPGTSWFRPHRGSRCMLRVGDPIRRPTELQHARPPCARMAAAAAKGAKQIKLKIITIVDAVTVLVLCNVVTEVVDGSGLAAICMPHLKVKGVVEGGAEC